ncbi:hypothetical protein KPH14_008794 [Odynerus spinipes]|uniref:Uncharacterized protein n=1 Tax=Odynerus spinipes TaxID=1348599 RepID=A0AAD9R8G2_9HYME|nr:hypothetical protein KPH14_008794 [Odynerus spinipes]
MSRLTFILYKVYHSKNIAMHETYKVVNRISLEGYIRLHIIDSPEEQQSDKLDPVVIQRISMQQHPNGDLL